MIIDLYLKAENTQDEIATAVDLGQKAVSDIIDGFSSLVLENQTTKNSANHQDGFEPPIYSMGVIKHWDEICHRVWHD
jgi:hypothetical protein